MEGMWPEAQGHWSPRCKKDPPLEPEEGAQPYSAWISVVLPRLDFQPMVLCCIPHRTKIHPHKQRVPRACWRPSLTHGSTVSSRSQQTRPVHWPMFKSLHGHPELERAKKMFTDCLRFGDTVTQPKHAYKTPYHLCNNNPLNVFPST